MTIDVKKSLLYDTRFMKTFFSHECCDRAQKNVGIPFQIEDSVSEVLGAALSTIGTVDQRLPCRASRYDLLQILASRTLLQQVNELELSNGNASSFVRPMRRA